MNEIKKHTALPVCFFALCTASTPVEKTDNEHSGQSLMYSYIYSQVFFSARNPLLVEKGFRTDAAEFK